MNRSYIGLIAVVLLLLALVGALVVLRPWQTRTPVAIDCGCGVARRDRCGPRPPADADVAKSEAPAPERTDKPATDGTDKPVPDVTPPAKPQDGPKDGEKPPARPEIKLEDDESLVKKFRTADKWREVDSAGRLTGKDIQYSQDQPLKESEVQFEMVLSGVTLDEGGVAVPGCTIGVLLHEGKTDESGSRDHASGGDVGFSDKHGAFRVRVAWRIERVNDTFLTLTATRDGFCASPATGIHAKTGEVSGLKLVLSLAARVTGFVRGKDGIGIGDVRVLVERDAIEHPDWPTFVREFPPIFSATTDPGGAFTFSELVAGTYSIICAARAWKFDGKLPGFSVRAGESLALPEIIATPQMLLRLRLVDGDGKDWRSRAVAHFFDSAGAEAGQHNIDRGREGLSAVIERVAPGTYRVRITTYEGELLAEINDVTLKAGQTTDLGEITLDLSPRKED